MRIAEFELLPWIYRAEAEPKMRELLVEGQLPRPSAWPVPHWYRPRVK